MNETEFRDFRKLVLEFLDKKEAEPFLQIIGLDIISLSLKVVDQTKDRTLAVETAAAVKKLFENSGTEGNRRMAYRPEAILNKHWVSEDGLKIKGIQHNSQEFDIASLKGKPVLVLLWTNSGLGDWKFDKILPHIKELYEMYHPKGFEIIDICIDARMSDADWEKKIQTFPWSIHISDRKTAAAGLLSIKEYYDIPMDHQFLVAPDGKVVVSKMSATFDDESLKKIGLTGDEAMKKWSDRYYTLELDEELKKMFP